jgi:N-acetylglutamate synthase-like GNAT family acetyltransferase
VPIPKPDNSYRTGRRWSPPAARTAPPRIPVSGCPGGQTGNPPRAPLRRSSGHCATRAGPPCSLPGQPYARHTQRYFAGIRRILTAVDMGRRSWLFAGSDRGSERAARDIHPDRPSSTASTRRPGSPTCSPASPITRPRVWPNCSPGTGAPRLRHLRHEKSSPAGWSSVQSGGVKIRPLIRPGRTDEIERFQAIDKAARARYATFPGFDFAAQAPPVAAERFGAGEVWVAQIDHALVGFLLLQSHLDTIYLANVSVVPEASGRGIGASLLAHSLGCAGTAGALAVTLATFRTPPWNGPWFHRQGFEPIPEDRINPMLRAILDRHSRYLDMSARETLWHPI